MGIWFVDLNGAERYLAAQGFVFVGAPNRWRRAMDGTVTYAEVRMSESGSLVVLRSRAPDIGQDGTATAGDRRDAG